MFHKSDSFATRLICSGLLMICAGLLFVPGQALASDPIEEEILLAGPCTASTCDNGCKNSNACAGGCFKEGESCSGCTGCADADPGDGVACQCKA